MCQLKMLVHSQVHHGFLSDACRLLRHLLVSDASHALSKNWESERMPSHVVDGQDVHMTIASERGRDRDRGVERRTNLVL